MGGSLLRRRAQAQRRTGLLLAALAGLIFGLPLPFYSVHQGVVWLPDEAIVRAADAGHVQAALALPGAAVAAGTPLLRLDNLALQAELRSAQAAVALTQAQLRNAEVSSPARAGPLRQALQARTARAQQAQQRVTALTVAASVAGSWVPAAPTELAGRFVKRGELLGYVVSGAPQRIRVAVTQEDAALVASRLQGAQVRLARQPGQALPAGLLRQVPGGGQELVSAALGSAAGGEIAVDPAKDGGTHSLRRVFDMELQFDGAAAAPAAVFGDRAQVRFDLGPSPLAWQWWLRLRQVFLARLNV